MPATVRSAPEPASVTGAPSRATHWRCAPCAEKTRRRRRLVTHATQSTPHATLTAFSPAGNDARTPPVRPGLVRAVEERRGAALLRAGGGQGAPSLAERADVVAVVVGDGGDATRAGGVVEGHLDAVEIAPGLRSRSRWSRARCSTGTGARARPSRRRGAAAGGRTPPGTRAGAPATRATETPPAPPSPPSPPRASSDRGAPSRRNTPPRPSRPRRRRRRRPRRRPRPPLRPRSRRSSSCRRQRS